MDKYVVGRLLHIRDAHRGDARSFVRVCLCLIFHRTHTHTHTNKQTGTMDDPLDHPDMCEAQLTHIPKLARYQYKEVCNIITSKSDVILQNYSQIVAQGGAMNANQQSQFAAIEGQLAWMTRMMGALIGGQIPLLNRQRIVAEGSGEELQDAQLCKRVFQLINFEVPLPRRPGSNTQVQLQLAFLYFLRFFKKACRSTQGYARDNSQQETRLGQLGLRFGRSSVQYAARVRNRGVSENVQAMGRGTYDRVIEFMIETGSQFKEMA